MVNVTSTSSNAIGPWWAAIHRPFGKWFRCAKIVTMLGLCSDGAFMFRPKTNPNNPLSNLLTATSPMSPLATPTQSPMKANGNREGVILGSNDPTSSVGSCKYALSFSVKPDADSEDIITYHTDLGKLGRLLKLD